MGTRYDRERLAEAVAGARSWNEVMRRLGVTVSGGRRRSLRRAVEAYGIDVSHFTRAESGVTYTDEAIARAVAVSTTLREVALRLGAVPASGTLSHPPAGSRRAASTSHTSPG